MNLSKNVIGARIRADKDIIIKMYNDAITIMDIAKEYNVGNYTITTYLRRWGCKVNRKEYETKQIKYNDFKRKFSKKFLANQAMNTAINNNSKHFKHFIRQDTPYEYKRIHSLIKRGLK